MVPQKLSTDCRKPCTGRASVSRWNERCVASVIESKVCGWLVLQKCSERIIYEGMRVYAPATLTGYTCHNLIQLCGVVETRRAHIPKIDGSKPSIANRLFFGASFPHPPAILFSFYAFDNHLPLVSTKLPSRKPSFHLCRIHVSLAGRFLSVWEGWGDMSHF